MKILKKGNLKFNGKHTGKVIKFTCNRCGCEFECKKSETIVVQEEHEIICQFGMRQGDIEGYRTTTTYYCRCPGCNNQVDK